LYFFTTSFYGTGRGQPQFQSIFKIVPTKDLQLRLPIQYGLARYMPGEPTAVPYLLHYIVLWDRAGSASFSVNFQNFSNERFTAAITNMVWLSTCQGNLLQFHIFFITSFYGTEWGQPHFQSIFEIVPTKGFQLRLPIWFG
jgi:hypothetical protein